MEDNMAQQLQGLLDKINQDGIAKAQEQSRQIIENAEKKANEIIAQAKQEAAQIVKNANVEGGNLTKRAESAINQSSRDIMLNLKSELEKRLNNVLANQTSQAMTPVLMTTIIKDLAEAFIKNPDEKITVLVAVKDVNSLTESLRASLKESFKNSVELFSDKDINGGFKVNFSNNDVFYDFSNDAIIELVSAYVTPKIAELLKK